MQMRKQKNLTEKMVCACGRTCRDWLGLAGWVQGLAGAVVTAAGDSGYPGLALSCASTSVHHCPSKLISHQAEAATVGHACCPVLQITKLINQVDQNKDGKVVLQQPAPAPPHPACCRCCTN